MITLLVVLIVLGVAVWAVNTYLPMEPPFKGLVILVAILIALLFVLNAFGIVNIPIR